jgi:hypothetical protein
MSVIYGDPLPKYNCIGRYLQENNETPLRAQVRVRENVHNS